MGIGDGRNSGLHLVLGLGLSGPSKGDHTSMGSKRCSNLTGTSSSCDNDEPSLTLGLWGESCNKKIDGNKVCGEFWRQSSPQAHSGVSSFSSGRVKRERDVSSEEADTERVSSRVSDEDEDGSNARKKLRLTKQQSALLEESFKQHSTLNPKQKQALARQLNLRARQVEVWFQNRRAREVEYSTGIRLNDKLKECFTELGILIRQPIWGVFRCGGDGTAISLKGKNVPSKFLNDADEENDSVNPDFLKWESWLMDSNKLLENVPTTFTSKMGTTVL
ncbi:homeobox-leucine zipper protein HAT22-like [Senna tora]|uniref:Homeobox-leucine zipper protein HAT22-like n=1 Tax=Senna tora TaxID=362788 RepID=A0A834U2H7_9FABA|nr:homeobox-leucine zipper protein HAT22-like [Senna tora]